MGTSKIREILTHDYTMKDIVGEEKYALMKKKKAYKFLSDWAGLASNKIVLGMYIDSRAGLPIGTSLIARTISVSVHSVVSPAYTLFRDFIYKKGNITPEKSKATRFGAEFLAYNCFQTPLYTTQVAVAMGIRAMMDSSMEFDPNTVGISALKFFTNSWWLVPAGKWSMDACRKFFGAETPEQAAAKAKAKEIKQPEKLEDKVISFNN